MNKIVLYPQEGSIAWVVFNRLEAQNALNYVMAEELEKVLNEIEADREVRVAVFTGQGEKAYISGSDIKELRERDILTGWFNSQKRQKILNRMDNLGKPTIAAVNGFAFGIGCELACLL